MSNNSAQTHSYRLAEGSTWQKLTYVGCLIAFIAFGSSQFMVGSGGLVFFPLLILIPLGVYAFRGIWDKRTVLTLGVEGIWFRPWSREVPLPWIQVRKIELLTIGPGEPFICFFLFDEHKYDAPKHSVRVSHLNVGTGIAYEVAMDYWHRFGPNASNSGYLP